MTPEEVQGQARLHLQWTNHLLDTDPRNADLWRKKASYFHDAMTSTIPHRPRLERVLMWYQRCIELDPTCWSDYYNSAVLLRDLNRYEEAVEYARSALEFLPTEPNSQLLLAEIQDRRAADATTADEVFVIETGDPRLRLLQFEIDELLCLGLFDAAESACVRFELEHGANALTHSRMSLLRRLRNDKSVLSTSDIDASFPLLDIVCKHLPSEYVSIVNAIFEADGVGRFITRDDVNDFDEQARWRLSLMTTRGISVNDPASFTRPLPDDLRLVWHMASLTFVVARRFADARLVAYAAVTLAELYERLGQSLLPQVLYTVAAENARAAGELNYFATAHGRCALQLMRRQQFGAALTHLERALKAVDSISPTNQHHLFETAAECSAGLSDLEGAKTYYRRAQRVNDLPEHHKQGTRLALLGLDAIASGEIADVSMPPVFCDGLIHHRYTVEIAARSQTLIATSKHELYDSLMQACENVWTVRRSLFERRAGRTYFESQIGFMDALVRTALELGLYSNALQHLEAQKSITLTNRLRYLLREKPADISEATWQTLQRLMSVYRYMVEGSDDPPVDFEPFTEVSISDVADGIAVTLWRCGVESASAASQIQQKLAFGTFPRTIPCAEPDQTRILEFYWGTCFVARPDDPRRPDVIVLPQATEDECERLAKELAAIVSEWRRCISDANTTRARLAEARFDAFLERLDEVFYRPIAGRLDSEPLKNLCIVPHRILHVLPLNLLGLSEDPRGGIGDRFNVSFAPSLTTLVSIVDPSARKPGKCVIVSNPVPRCRPEECRNAARDCYSIAGSERESRSIVDVTANAGLAVAVISGADATLAAVQAQLPSADMVHIASHGFFSSATPEASGIVLALPKEGERNGQFFLHDQTVSDTCRSTAVGEILSLDYVWKNIDMFRCQLLNLSACSSGMVDVTDRSDEFYGIANGFISAGVHSILNNVWPVHDEASAVFNVAYYRSLLANQDTYIGALRSAVQSLRDHETMSGRPFVHPLFWGGYRIIGFR